MEERINPNWNQNKRLLMQEEEEYYNIKKIKKK